MDLGRRANNPDSWSDMLLESQLEREEDMKPYQTGGDPNHPGVQGKPFAAGMQPPNQDVLPGKVDVLGTGTFPPEAQGSVGRAQPTGLSAKTQYGIPSSGIIPGESTVLGPVTHPVPADAEEGAIGLAPEPVTRESILQAKQERLQAQQDELRAQMDAGKPTQSSVASDEQVPVTEVEDNDEDDDEEE